MLTVPFLPAGAEMETAGRPAVSVSVMFPPLPWEIVTMFPFRSSMVLGSNPFTPGLLAQPVSGKL
jgi:hypothetical protein